MIILALRYFFPYALLPIFLFVGVFYYIEARKLSRLQIVDRYEVMFLKPLGLMVFGLSILYLTTKDWITGIILMVVWFIAGAIGASLHPDKNFSELTKGTMPDIKKITGVTDTEPLEMWRKANIVSSLSFKVSFLVAIVIGLVWKNHGASLLASIGLALLCSIIFLFVSSKMVHDYKKHSLKE